MKISSLNSLFNYLVQLLKKVVIPPEVIESQMHKGPIFPNNKCKRFDQFKSELEEIFDQ